MHDQRIRYSFADFTFDVPQLTLARDGQPVKLGGRAANLLAVLAAADGELVGRDRLLEAVWPGQAIDDSVVRVHLSSLRKALGDPGLISNEAGRGYRLSLPVQRLAQTEPGIAPPSYRPLAGLIGRDDVVQMLLAELPIRRFLTLVGPGGIGKTAIALAVAAELDGQGITRRFVDFAPLADADLVESTVAASLGLPASGSMRFSGIANTLAATPSVLVLDNCEHLIEAVAGLAERLGEAVPGLMLLATSREPLRATGEWVHRLPALAVPDDAVGDAASVLRFPAASLFYERARAVRADFVVDDGNAAHLAEICRRLDGIPLAIELAAARIDIMDLPELAHRLHDRLNLLTRGRRTALPRHRTLRAALDWSYDLLPPPEQRLLMSLSLFRADFDGADARGMAEGRDIDVLDSLAGLVAKSLVVSSPAAGGMRYRLLDTTRYYGHERLAEAGLERETHARHARYLIDAFADAADAWKAHAPCEWQALHSRRIDDVRAALDWSLADDGDLDLALELIVTSAALWFHLSLPFEFIGRAARVIAAVDRAGTADPARRVELLAAYGHAIWHARGPVPEMADTFARALSLAETVDDEDLIRRALWGVWAHRLLTGDYRASLALAAGFGDRIGPAAGLACRQSAMHMMALSHHFLGDDVAALALMRAMTEADVGPLRINHANHARIDGRVAATSLMVRLQWHLGQIGDAMALARRCADEAVGTDHALSICYGLALGCIPVAIAAGRHDLARHWIDVLDQRSTRHALEYWRIYAAGFAAALGADVAVPESACFMQREMFAAARRDAAAAIAAGQ